MRNSMILVAGTMLLAGCGDAGAGSAGEAEAASAAEPAMEVSARDLFSAYEANEVAAQQTYGGKPLKVTGSVQGVTLDFMDNPVIQLATSNEFLPVQATVDDADAAASISKGTTVTVLCDELTEVIGAPQLSGCTLAE